MVYSSRHLPSCSSAIRLSLKYSANACLWYSQSLKMPVVHFEKFDSDRRFSRTPPKDNIYLPGQLDFHILLLIQDVNMCLAIQQMEEESVHSGRIEGAA